MLTTTGNLGICWQFRHLLAIYASVVLLLCASRARLLCLSVCLSLSLSLTLTYSLPLFAVAPGSNSVQRTEAAVWACSRGGSVRLQFSKEATLQPPRTQRG